MSNRLGFRFLAAAVFFTVAVSVSFFNVVNAQELPTIIAPDPAEGVTSPEPSRAPAAAQFGQPVIGNIVVEGIQRIEYETILSYLSFKTGDPLDPTTVNKSLKTLFASGLFADVTIRRQGDDIIIRLVENPIINRIAFEKNDKIKDEVLTTEVQLRPRVVYTRTRVQNDVKRILDVYRRSGRFAASVEPKVIQLAQNRVDLVFEIDEGPKTGVTKISFVGNRFFSDGSLRTEVFTKESRWYRFLSSADSYDPDKLTFDRELLRRYYLKNGFADFRVISAVAELSEDRTGFYITFTIEEGERYQFGEYTVASKIKDIESEPLMEHIELETDDWYDADLVDETIDRLTDAVGIEGYAFVDVRPNIDRDRENRKINIEFEINEGPRVYVERIDIRGNTRTLDKVLRREFKLVEGDAFNSAKLRRSKSRISNLGFFKVVEVNNVPGSRPDTTIVQVDLEEQSTGELSIGGGFSTQDGVVGSVSLTESNFLGKGQRLSTTFDLGASVSDFNVSFTEPYFLDKDLSAGADIFHSIRDNQDESSFDSRQTGAGVRFGYEISRYWSQRLRYRYSNDTIENIDDDASLIIKSQEGEANTSVVGHTLTYDRRNNIADPTSGYLLQFGNDFAGVGGDVNYFKTTAKAVYYYGITDDIVLTSGIEVGDIFATNDDDIRIFDRYFIGGNTLRGFESGGVGPRDTSTDDALGGQQFASGSVEVEFPLGLPDEFGLTGAVFTDAGLLTTIDESGPNIVDTGNLRATVGVGVNWISPFGPIRVDIAQAILKEDHDKTESFRFNFGTRF